MWLKPGRSLAKWNGGCEQSEDSVIYNVKTTGANTTILIPCPKHHLWCRISSWNSGGWKEIFIPISRTEIYHPSREHWWLLTVLQNLPEDSEEVKKKKKRNHLKNFCRQQDFSLTGYMKHDSYVVKTADLENSASSIIIYPNLKELGS